MSSERLHLPKLPLPVESSWDVRARARTRVGVVGGLLGLLLVAVGLRGAQLCVAPAKRTVVEGSAQRWDQVTLRARRGDILDRNGRRLATSVQTPNIAIDPMVISPEQAQVLAPRLAALLDLPESEILRKMGRKSRYVRLAMRVHPKVAAQVRALRQRGVWVERDARRYYPEGALASQVVGFVDGSGVGRSGLEADLDGYLRGASVLVQRRRDRRGLDVDRPAELDARQNLGRTVHTTIDRTIQHQTERALAGVMERYEPLSASAIVVDVRTGDILALANVPTYNPNDVGDDPAVRRNHVVQDAIEPGSVFKPFTMAAAVEEGRVKEDTLVNCEGGVWAIGRTRIHDDHPHRMITASEVIKYSSNIGAAKLALGLGAKTFISYLHRFGFGERTGVFLPGERRGVLRRADRIRPIEIATTAFGQGTTSTPLQLVMATATLANDGVRMKPRLVTRIEDVDGVPELVQEPQEVVRVVSSNTAAAVTRMMVMVTEKGGTATRARVPGYKVAGKTGTAQKVKDGKYGSARIGSFMGFAPADNPVIAIVVTVDEPSKVSRYGGIVAAPAFAEIAGQALRYLGVAPDPTLLKHTPEDLPAPPAAPEPVRLAWSGTEWRLPDLSGHTLREVLAGLQGVGLEVRLEGSGRAVHQEPAAGALVAAGMPVSIFFQ